MINPAQPGAPLSTTTPAAVGSAAIGTGTSAARADHVHAHGDQLGGTLHANADANTAGFQSAAHFSKVAGIATGAPKGTYEFSASASTTVNTLAFLFPAASTNSTVGTTNEVPAHSLLVGQPCKVVAMYCITYSGGAGTGGAAVTLRVATGTGAPADTSQTFNHPNGPGGAAIVQSNSTDNQTTLAAGDRISVSFVTQTGLSTQYTGGIKVTLVTEAV